MMASEEVRMDKRYHWVWSTRPTRDHVTALDGKKGEWTCHKDTRDGDLVLVYLSADNSHIGYLVKATSDARPPSRKARTRDPWAGHPSCDFEVLARFPQPLTFQEMMADQFLASRFSALRAYFRRSAYEVKAEVWDHLVELLATANPTTKDLLRRAGAFDT